MKPENRPAPAVGSVIAGVTSESASFQSLVDGSGLGHNDSDRLIEHNTNEDSMWTARSDSVTEGLVFDLSGQRMLESIAVWNYNKPAYTDMGVQRCDIAVWTADGGWKTVLKGADLLEAEGSDDYDEPTILTFEPVAAEKVRFANLTAFNSKAGQVGLSEVAFYEPLGPAACNPEPGEGAKAACLDVVPLLWTAGRGAIAHDVYIGQPDTDLVLLGRVKGLPQVKVSGLSADTDYIWRIDEVAKDGSVEQGPVWRFHVRGQQIGHWKLDGSGEDAVGQYSGSIQGDPSWQDGHTGQAILLDGKDDFVEIPALNLNTETMTICAWINVSQPAAVKSGVVFSRAGQTTAGINLRENNLRYHWNNELGTYSWNSGLMVPEGRWVFVALTVVPDKATLYLYDGNELRSAENPIQHTVEEFNGPLCIGRDPYDNRYFKGAIDEVRVFDYALSQSHIMSIIRDEAIAQNERTEIQLVDADWVTAGESLDDLAAEAQADTARSKNLIPVIVIILVIAVFAVFSMARKKK